MTDNIRLLPTAPPAPDKDVIEILEKYLERAKAGEITRVVVAYEMADGGYGHSASSTRISTVGVVADMLWTLLTHRNGEGE